jgi:hypothetical protein
MKMPMCSERPLEDPKSIIITPQKVSLVLREDHGCMAMNSLRESSLPIRVDSREEKLRNVKHYIEIKHWSLDNTLIQLRKAKHDLDIKH